MRKQMQIEITLPDDIGNDLKTRWGNVSQHAAEALAVQAYKEGLLTEAQVQKALGLPSRWAVEELLHRSNAYLDYTEEDLNHDIEAIEKTTS